jgi:MFS transporter, SP family, general alpha glucoside:H+ symporter
MATVTVVPTDRDLKVMDFSSADTQDLIREAEANDAADRALTIFEALKKYKKAVFWAMFLSTSLIMEGYDVVIVSFHFARVQLAPDTYTLRSLLSTDRHNSSRDSVSSMPRQDRS